MIIERLKNQKVGIFGQVLPIHQQFLSGEIQLLLQSKKQGTENISAIKR